MLPVAQIQPSSSEPLVWAAMFYAAAALVVASAWAIVLSGNIVRMAAYLLGALAGVAGLYFLLAAELLAAIQLIVYAGGTLILIVFGIMLTQRHPFTRLRSGPWERLAGLIVSVALALLLLLAARLTPPATPAAEGGVATVETFGRALLSQYLVPFEVAGVLLLVVMVGAAYMARRRTHPGGTASVS